MLKEMLVSHGFSNDLVTHDGPREREGYIVFCVYDQKDLIFRKVENMPSELFRVEALVGIGVRGGV